MDQNRRHLPRFGLAVPTATEGMMYPVPYADEAQAVELAIGAEGLGFDSVWGNDHISTQRYVRQEFADPPRFFDPLTYLAYVAAATTTLRLGTCVLVLPFRHPAMVAKQAATLDRLSGGRFVLGVGVGAYREEFEAMYPNRALHRGSYVHEFLEALEVLFRERRASYRGDLIQFVDIESYPKPAQQPFPILSGGNSPGARRRAGVVGNGWLPACLTPDEYRAGMTEIRDVAGEIGRELSPSFEAALQLVVSLGDTREAALERFRSSQVHAHLTSLGGSTMRGRLGDGLEGRNLVGTADDIGDTVTAYLEAGVATFAGLLFATDSVDETHEAMARFSEEVVTPFAEAGRR